MNFCLTNKEGGRGYLSGIISVYRKRYIPRNTDELGKSYTPR